MKFEEEYQVAEGESDSERENLRRLVFQQDLNLDGDTQDSGENIAYRWNEKERRIDRKSGKGYFQALLDGVIFFSWRATSTDLACHEMKIQDAFSLETREIIFCR